MPTITVKKLRISAKNGVVSYKADTKRGTPTIYFMPKCFAGGIPEEVTITGDFLTEPVVEVPAVPAAAPDAVAAAAADSGLDSL
jgi:hypothetical protein